VTSIAFANPAFVAWHATKRPEPTAPRRLDERDWRKRSLAHSCWRRLSRKALRSFARRVRWDLRPRRPP